MTHTGIQGRMVKINQFGLNFKIKPIWLNFRRQTKLVLALDDRQACFTDEYKIPTSCRLFTEMNRPFSA
jgi:hypothetical protein